MLKKLASLLAALALCFALPPAQAQASNAPEPPQPPAVVEPVEPETPEKPVQPASQILEDEAPVGEPTDH